MATGFLVSGGADLDTIFDQTSPGSITTGYKVSGGGDLGARYTPLASGTAAAATGFKNSSGADLNTLFAALGTAVYSGTLTSVYSGTTGLYGYSTGSYGAISPTSWKSQAINALWGDSGANHTVLQIAFASSPGQSWFTTLTINGTNYLTSGATYSYGGGVAQWTFPSYNITAAGSYTVGMS